MGRHCKKSSSTIRRNSLIALTGLVPAGLVTEALVTHAPAAQIASDVVSPVAHNGTTALDRVTPAVADAKVVNEPVAAPAPPPPAEPVLPTSVKASPLGVPNINVAAYKAAEVTLAAQNPACGMSWTLLAGIGRVESTHANDGKADEHGNLLSPIYGPILDGSLYGNNVIHDTDNGALDGNASYDRAVGPMQFLPETWKKYAADGNGDGVADPQNLFDAALTTGRYLCDGGLNMRDLAQQTKAILRYNNSMAYVANVMAWSVGYATGIVPAPAALPQIH